MTLSRMRAEKKKLTQQVRVYNDKINNEILESSKELDRLQECVCKLNDYIEDLQDLVIDLPYEGD